MSGDVGRLKLDTEEYRSEAVQEANNVLELLAGTRDDPSLPTSGLTSSDPFTILAA